MTKHIAALTVALLLTAPARAIELSLEENRAERGSVGFVDMQRLFTNSPDAQHAREGFEDLIRQAEERVNLRKAELLKLRLSLEALRAEREAVVASSATVVPAPTPAPTPTPVPAPAPAPAGPTPKTLALPGMTPADTATAPPAASTAASAGLDGLLAAKVTTPAVAVATTPAPSAPTTAAAPAPTLGQRLLELDGKIIALQAEVSRKEGELTREHDDADRGLLDVESRKTDQVLARLYRAITEVARREGVSVVVDKTTILYGHPAVDITDKVLKHLKEAPQP